MGRLELNVPQLQRSTRQVPLNEIVSVEGQNPLAQGLTSATGDISQVLAQKAQMRKMAQQTKVLAKAGGIDIPDGTPDQALADPDTFVKLHGLIADKNKVAYEKAAKKADLKLQIIKLSQPQSIFDANTGKTTTTPGAIGYDVGEDANGLPIITQDPNATPGNKPPKIIPRESGSGPGGAFKNEKQLRGEFQKESAPFVKSAQAASEALNLAERKDAASDTRLVFALTRGALGGQGRIAQPELAANGPMLGGFDDKVRQAIRGLADGTKFDDNMREQIKSMVQSQYQNDDADQTAREKRYSDLAIRNKLNPANVISNLRPNTLRPIQSGADDATVQALINKHK